MAKVKHITRTFGSSSFDTSNPAVFTLGSHGTPNLPSDTLARSIFSIHFNTSEDDTVNPPPYDWWQGARCVFAVAWSPTGTATLPASENSTDVKGRVLLYPELWYSSATNGLHGVSFRPRADTIQFRARHKGNGTNTGKYSFGLYLHDNSGVLQNGGGLYSVVSGYAYYATTIWESDT